MKFFNIISLLVASCTSVYADVSARDSTNTSSPIITTKVTPSYWRATFASPPFNIQNNAWFEAFYALIEQISKDPDVKVIVFDSSAPDFWIAHYDIVNPVLPAYDASYWGNVTLLANLPVLTIAAVQGIVRGGGVELVAALDLVFGSRQKAKFGQIEVGIGLVPGDGGMSLLARSVGRNRALEIVLGAEDFDADTAAQYGWINRAIPDHHFEKFIDSFARRVASFDKFAITEAKQIINKRAGYPTAAEATEDYKAFIAAASQSNVQARIGAMIGLGLQTDLDFEVHADQRILQVEGEGPWNVSGH